MHNLEVESYVLFSGQNWGQKPRKQHLKYSWLNCSKEVWLLGCGGGGAVGIMQQRAGSRNKRFPENQISQVKQFSPFLWEDAKFWTHWNHSFDMDLSYLVPVSCIFTVWIFSGLALRSGCSPTAARWLVYFFLSWVPSEFTGLPLEMAALADCCDILCFVYLTTAWADSSEILHHRGRRK